MKKLMTMIGAAVAAFGLYAENAELAVDNAINFDDLEAGAALDLTAEDSAGQIFWYKDAAAEVEATVTAYDAPATGNYLKLDAEAPLYRTFADVNGAADLVPVDIATADRGGVIVNQKVLFSAFDEAPDFTDSDAKIAVWVKTVQEEVGDTPAINHLMITTAKLSNRFVPATTNLDTGIEVDVAKWYPLEIKAIEAGIVDGTDVVPGFTVKFGDQVITAPEGFFPEATGVYTSEGAALIAANKLFPSLIQCGTTDAGILCGVAYKGSGSVDDIAITPADLYDVEIVLPTNPGWVATAGVTKAAPDSVIDVTLTANQAKLFKDGDSVKVVEGTVGKDGTVTLEDGDYETADALAKIADKFYLTLNAAFEAAVDKDEIEVIANVTLSERIFIGSADGDKDITLDLAGKTITWDASVANASGVLIVCSGSKLTVNDKSGTNAGKIDANGKAYAAIAVTHGNYQNAEKTASLIVNGGTLVGFYQGIAGNGKRPNTYVEINGGVITATNTTAEDGNLAIFNPQQNSQVVINGGTLTGLWAAIEMRGGTLTVNNGTLTATAEAYAVKPNGSGSTTAGAAVAVAQHTTKGDVAVEIKGGTLTGLNAVSVANPQENATDNVAVTLGAATYNGALAFSADGNATVTNNGADLDAPEGYQWNTETGVLEPIPPAPTFTVTFSTNTVTVAEKTLTDVEEGTELKAEQIPDFGEGTWDVNPLGAIITCDTNFNFTVKAEENWDVPEDKKDAPASEVWTKVPQNLADVPAGRLSTWAKANNVPFGGDFTDVMEEAYLLNCAPDKVAETKTQINIASIEFVDNEWVIKTVSEDEAGDEFGNGKLQLVDVTEAITGAEGSDATKLWKMKLVPITATK